MAKQPHLPGISSRPTAADVKALVASRLVGFELRQEERARRRAQRAQRRAAAACEPPSQPHLCGHDDHD